MRKHDNLLYLYRIQHVQATVLFRDKAKSSRHVIMNFYKNLIWSNKNPHTSVAAWFKQIFSVNDIIDVYSLIPLLLSAHLIHVPIGIT